MPRDLSIHLEFGPVDAILREYRVSLGGSYEGYRNHVHRVLNFYMALGGRPSPLAPAVSVAAAFHDLAIWTDDTFDYLEPSACLACRHLVTLGLQRLEPEVRALIADHHKMSRHEGPFSACVEPFRQADWVDVSMGWLRFGLPQRYVRAVQAAFPDAGFHAGLAWLSVRQLGRTPWRPLPMLRR